MNDKQWQSLVSHFDSKAVEYTTYRTIIPAISQKRRRYYAIRIGDKGKVDFGNKSNTFPNQLQLQKKEQMPTPRPSRALQRQLLGGVSDRIIATILREKDLYEAAMKTISGIRGMSIIDGASTIAIGSSSTYNIYDN